MQRLPFLLVTLTVGAVSGAFAADSGVSSGHDLTTVDRIIRSRTDLWGDAAVRQENGPSYEFFKRLLPPIRYVNAPFGHYPLVLCSPGNPAKARFVGNGSDCGCTTLHDY